MALSNKNLRDNAIKLTEDQVNILLGNSKISDKVKNYTAKRVANTSSSIRKIGTSTSDNGITDAVHRMVVNNQKLTNTVDNESLAKNTSQLKENTSTLKENTIAKEENANAQKDDISSRVSAMASRGETLTNPESIRKSTTDISKTMTELDHAGMKLMHEHEENFSHVSDIMSDLAKTDEKLMHEHEETFANVSDIVSEMARNNEVLMRDSALDPELSSSTAQFDSNTASIERNTQAKLENKAATNAQKNAVEQETIAQTTNTTSQSGGDISSRVHELAINGGSLVGNDKEQIKDISATVSELNQSGIKLMQEHEDYSVAMANIISELDQNGQKLMTEHEVPNFGNVAQTVSNVEQALTSTATKADDVATKVSELAKNNEVLMKDVAEVGTTTAASVGKVASETSKFGIFMSSLGSEITGLFTGAAGALNAVFAWVGVISLVATGIYKIYDALTLTVDEAEEARSKAVSDLSEAQSNLESINSELETTQQRIDELNGKDKLTFTEQGELEDLKEKNKLLQLQADAAERIQKSKQQDLLNTDSENFDKLYANNISEKNVKETKNYYKDLINALDPKETDISGQIAQLELLQDQYTKLSKAEYLADDMNSAKESIDNVTSSLNKQLETLINMESDYQAVGYENLTDKQKNEYSQIENAIKLIYKSLDPGKYNEISVDDIFNTKDIEATKDDLIELAQAGKLDEKTLNQYPKLTKAIKDADLIAKDGTNATKAFINAIIALGDASEDIEANETNETTISLSDINKTKSGIGGLFDKYEQNEGYLTQDEVASVLETNPEYIQYLVKVGDQYKLNEQALNDWNEANKEQEQEINNQMGGNDYLGNYSSLLDSIQDNASHPNGGVGNTNIGSQLDDLINKNKEWNTSLQNGEITTAQYFQNMSNAITDSGLEDALHSLNGTFDDSTDYIEETVSVLTTQLSDGLTQSTKRFEEGQTSVQDYIKEINAGSDAEKKLLASTYNLDISQETGKASLDGLSDSALEAAQSYNSLVDSQNALASTSGFVDVLSQNADFLSQYTDEAGNLMDSIFDDSRFNDYVSNMSNSIVDFANQNADTMDQTASWLADTAGMSVEQASSIIAQGGDAVQGAVGNSLSGVQSMTSYAMSQVGSATSNAASAVGNVLTSLGNMISNFSYKITAKPFMQGKSKVAWNPKTGLDVSLPTFGFDISGSGGKSVSAFATSIKNAGSAISKYGASQSASAAFNNINSYKPKRELSANKPSSYRPTYKPKSSGKSGGGSKSPSSGSGSGSEKEPTKKDYDWIETLISRINRQVSNLGKTVSATYKTWSTRNNALAQELGSVNQQISAEQQAYNKYMQLANSVGLPEGYASLVRNGTIDVSTIQDDDLNDKIEKYQNYYNKALEASDAVQDLQDKLAELAKTKFDNVNSEYEAQLKQIDHSINVYDKMIDTAETQGYITSQKYYNALISTESSNISKLQLQYSSLTSARNEAMKAGNIAKYSEEWYSMTDSINSVEEAIQDANKSLIEYKNNLRQVKWDFFDKQEDYISKLQDESDWLINLITTENKLFNSDNGKITSSGKAVEGLHAINYNAYMTQADDYAKEIKKIDAEIANDPANTTLIERRQELLEQQRDMIKSAEDEKSAIKDLVSDGYDALSKALKKIADNYLDALNAQKDLYDYAKTIREQTKAVAQYEKQLEAIKNDTSEEAKAQIQQIKVKLEDAKQDLADSEYNQWISDQQNIVDTFESDLEDWINSRLDDLDELVQNVIDQTNTSASEINDVIEKEAGDVGYTVSDAISKVMDVDSTNGTNMVNFYDKTFPNEMTTTRNSIDAIKNLLQAMKDAADKKAQEEIKKQQAAQQAISNPASSSSSSSSSSSNSHSSNNSGSSSSSSGWGSWFVHKADSYPKSKLRINSSIVDRLKLHNFDSSKSARAGYYKAMGGSGTYVGSASQNNWMISEMKKHGFKQGGTIGKLIRSTGEDGFVLARTGEEILSKEKLIMLKDALQYIPQNFNIASTSLPKFTQKASNSSVDVKVDFGGITMNGVNNPEEFVTELQKSKRFEKIVQSITVDTAMGKNSLGKYKF